MKLGAFPDHVAPGRRPDRRAWRLVREVHVAFTDDEARKRVPEGAMGRCGREYLLPFYVGDGSAAHVKPHPDEPDSALDVDYLIEHNWFVGSRATVRDQIAALQAKTGGFVGLLVMLYDFSTEPEERRESLDLLVSEVMPHLPEDPS